MGQTTDDGLQRDDMDGLTSSSDAYLALNMGQQ